MGSGALACDDGNACTDDSCDPGSGCKATVNAAACDDGDACTVGDACKAAACKAGTAKSCDDGDACTTDACDAKTGTCTHTGSCPAEVVWKPGATESFPCGATPAGWVIDDKPKSGTKAYWGIDATPAYPVAKSPGCSLNFNDGSAYTCTSKIDASARLPKIDATGVLAGQTLKLSFWLAGTWEGAYYDDLDVDVSADGKSWKLLQTFDPPGGKFFEKSVDLGDWKGKVFWLRFRFKTYDCTNNNTSGAFIDDVALVAGGGCGKAADCDDGDPCTSDTCDGVTQACKHGAAPDGTPCEDGDACTLGDGCKSGVCWSGAWKDCDDKDACTIDGCAAGTCTHAPNALCGGKAKALPFSEPFACGSDTGWTLTGTPGGPGWNIDANPTDWDFTAYKSASCSANFNDGTDYQCPKSGGTPTVASVGGALTSPALDGTGVASGEKVWLDLWVAGQVYYGDVTTLEVTTDGATWTPVRTIEKNLLSLAKWRQLVVELPGVAGKTFAFRLRFQSGDCVSNNYLGIYVDDVKVYAAGACKQTDPWEPNDFNGGHLVGGYTMGVSAPLVFDPELALGENDTDKVYWYVTDSYTNPMSVHVQWQGAAKLDVCVYHQCYKSKAYACSTTCPAGYTKHYQGNGCCKLGADSGDVTFKPIGNPITSGYTYFSISNKAPMCQSVSVKAWF